jgi:hypothetical protein
MTEISAQQEGLSSYKASEVAVPANTTNTNSLSLRSHILIMHLPFATDASFSHISVNPIHPTFGAEVREVDFSKPLTDEVFSEIYSAITKVGREKFHGRGNAY